MLFSYLMTLGSTEFCFVLLGIHTILCYATVPRNSEKCMVVKTAYRFYRFVSDSDVPYSFPGVE